MLIFLFGMLKDVKYIKTYILEIFFIKVTNDYKM